MVIHDMFRDMHNNLVAPAVWRNSALVLRASSTSLASLDGCDSRGLAALTRGRRGKELSVKSPSPACRTCCGSSYIMMSTCTAFRGLDARVWRQCRN